LAGSLCV